MKIQRIRNRGDPKRRKRVVRSKLTLVQKKLLIIKKIKYDNENKYRKNPN